MGSISYTSFSDAIRRRRWSRLRLDTKLVFSGMALMLLIGFVAFIAAEWSNPDTIGQESVNGKITESLFHTVNRASGFSTIDYAEIHDSNIAVTSVLMFVGGASATTTAGIKVSTLMVIGSQVLRLCVAKGRHARSDERSPVQLSCTRSQSPSQL